MGKRGADRQLTKDDAEDEDDNGSVLGSAVAASNSTRAAPDVLARRKIIHLARSKDGKIDLTQKPTVVNPFAHVNLVAPAVPPAAVAAAAIDSAASSAAPTIPSDAAPTVLSDAAPTTTSTDAATTASAHKKVKTIAATDKEDEAATAAAGNDAKDNKTAAPTVDSTANTNTAAVDDSDATAKPTAASFGGFGSTGFKGFAEAGGTSSGFGAAASGFSFGGGGAASSSVFGQGAAAPAFQFAAVPVAGVADASGGSAKNDDDAAAGDAAPLAAPVANLPKTYEVPSGEEHETVLMTVRCLSKRWGPSSSAGAATTDGTKKAAVLAVPPSAQLQNVTKMASSSDETAQGTENGKAGDDTKAAIDAKTSGIAAAAASTSEFQWLDIGTGPLKLLQDNDDASKLRLVQRREQTHRGPATTVILNFVLYQETTTQHVAEKMVKIILPAAVRATLSSDELTSQTYLFKFSEASDATDFYTRVLAECTAHAKPFFDSSRSGTGSNDE